MQKINWKSFDIKQIKFSKKIIVIFKLINKELLKICQLKHFVKVFYVKIKLLQEIEMLDLKVR